MAKENNINISFSADDQITPVINKIKGSLGGFNQYGPESGAFMGDELGADFAQFQESLESTATAEAAVTEETNKLDASFLKMGKSGLSVGTKSLFSIAGAGMAAIGAIKYVVKEMEELVKLSEKKPELFTPEQLKDVQAYGEAVAVVADNFTELKIKALSPLMAGLADDLERINNADQSGRGGRKPIQDLADDYSNAASNVESYDRALTGTTQTQELSIKQIEALGKIQDEADKKRLDAIKELTKANQEYLDDIGYWSDQYEKKAETAASIAEARGEIEADLAQARAQGWWEGSDKIQGYIDKLADLDEKEQEAAENWEENIAKRKLAMLEELLSADGELTEAELQSLEEKGVAWGVYTEEAIAQEQALRAEVQGLANDIMGIPDRTINIEVNATGSGLALIGGEGETKAKVGVKGKKAAGGPVSGGDSYLVGEQGPELFTPGASGQITSNANLGGIDEKRLARLITAAMLKGLAQQ